ncbi:sigma-70 family RNA polymerase sigma factor [Amycolatopsis sp. cg5]|uniref:sigma-70 family RNA polymerase sigma factor n=1 Tax=Amycolatopsis sp. cg5 TaxID=3238802 RepID=UPI003524CAE6
MKRSRNTDDEVTRWARAAARGSKPDLDRFLRATQPDVWRFVAHLSDIQSADDLTQETYLRALKSLPRFEGRSMARTWLLSIARRVAADHLRTARRRPRLVPETGVPMAGRARFEDLVVLNDLIKALDPDRQEAFVLTQELGLSYAEAAGVCGCPVGTIRSRVARARADLLTAMADPAASATPA